MVELNLKLCASLKESVILGLPLFLSGFLFHLVLLLSFSLSFFFFFPPAATALPLK